MLAKLSEQVATEWAHLPEPDKGIVTAAAILFGLILLVLAAAVLFVST